MEITLRDYQKEAVETVGRQPPGAYLLQLATGLGKTVIGAHLPREGRMLWLSHREELVYQPQKYFDCSFGIERAGVKSHGEEVVSASVQTLVRRLEKFDPEEFDIVLVDEAHHAAAGTYTKILDYFRPRLRIGITATPNRGDHVRLDSVFEKIIFQRDLRWGIEHGYLTDIHCLRANIGFDLSAVKSRMGDYAPGELEEAMEGTADAIAEAYRDYAKGPTLIFAVSIHQAEEIAARIPGAAVVTGETKDRAGIIKDFTDGKIPVIVNVMVFTEGTDIPRVETVIIARPTQSESLYCLDEDTEVLTKHGWRKDVNPGDMVAAYDMESGEIKYTPAIATVRRRLELEEYFCSIKGPCCDIRVTNRHRMLYRNKQDKEWRVRTAEEVADRTSGSYLPVAGHTEFPGVPLTDDEIRFIAWVMTDGTINKCNNAICITQSSTQPWHMEIERVIRSCGFKFGTGVCNSETRFNRNGDNIYWTVSKGKPRGRDRHLRGWKDLGPYLSKDFAPKLHRMTERQFDILLETCHLADGHKQTSKDWTQRSYHITKGNKTFLENLQIAAIQRGWRANLSTAVNSNGNPIYTLHLKKQDFINVGQSYDTRPAWNKEPHTDEDCWCVQNRYGTLVTRRNGKVAIVGNCQMVGRGLRLYPGKEKLTLIDCVGVTGKRSLCTAPSLLGIDVSLVPERKQDELQGDLFELPEKAVTVSDVPESWIRNVEIVDLWAREQSYDLHNVSWFKMPDGSLVLSLPEKKKMVIPCPDSLGMVTMKDGSRVPMQEALDRAYNVLNESLGAYRYIWDRGAVKKWSKKPASESQLKIINRMCRYFDTSNLTKGEASLILNRLFNGQRKTTRS